MGSSLPKPCIDQQRSITKKEQRPERSGAAEARLALVLIDIFDRVLDGRDLLGGIVRDLDPELFLESHDELDDVEAVGAEIVDEARIFRNLVGFDAEMFDDDLLHPIGSLAHARFPPLELLSCPSLGFAPRQVGGVIARTGAARQFMAQISDCFATLAMTTIERPLTFGETALARTVFGDAVDYAPIRLVRRKWWPLHPRNAAMAPTGNIHFHPHGNLWSEDFSTENVGKQGLFIHEMVHVWQSQTRGRLYLPLMRHPFCRYPYQFDSGRPFDRYGLEQQAEIARHVFMMRNGRTADGWPPLAELERILPF